MLLDITQLATLFVAGILGGILNSIAGGGSFITFPALLLAGVPPITANATNTFAACAGYISGTYAFRREIVRDRANLAKIIVLSLFGGITGSFLLIQVSEQQFVTAVPWLLLVATLLFLFGDVINNHLKKVSSHAKLGLLISLMLSLFLIGVGVFGGFFNAGLGVIGLSYLAVAGYRDINLMNGLKLLISTCVSAIAIVLFIFNGLIDWQSGIAVMLGTLTGGYFAADLSRKVPQSYVRGFVALSSIAITCYFFYDTYL
ncbi:sulfite exporter TauE/SafE family protein [Vibrio mediterranei]|uniref:sulfite exporter TauE/SafE family protein n=1 Tax=Vibrio TaxID=662 RepID=UPI00178D0B7A|nr:MULTISPECIES: sulfite exporter TauE/SafE family protein [Vibrio]MCF4173896.1 sulfite exporter TauE/SafE family protein [Vibrio sp. McD22-P3]NUW74566.1 sulfite exporter TauE/SafE family protein [Vibrio mediterranei]USE03061.1 sulfite exporter TauE/SafE family protein [Vibrio sp. SCSIO 43133]